jgi:hypothetical protein
MLTVCSLEYVQIPQTMILEQIFLHADVAVSFASQLCWMITLPWHNAAAFVIYATVPKL